jgi:hypothetical protein
MLSHSVAQIGGAECQICTRVHACFLDLLHRSCDTGILSNKRCCLSINSDANSPVDKRVQFLEWAVAIAGSLLVVTLCLTYFMHAGALWRDEVNSVELANQASLVQVIHDLEYDSFPLLWHIVVRGWSSVAGTSDTAMRLFGLGVGISLVAVLWLASRTVNRDVPLISLALLGANAAVMLFGNSVRGYGLGMVLDVLAIILAWQLINQWSTWRAAVSLLAMVLCAHMLFYNAVVVFAICMGASAVLAMRKQWKRIAVILLMGTFTAATLVPYIWTIRSAARWNMIVRIDFTWIWFGLKFMEALTTTGEWMPAVLIALSFGTLVLGVIGIVKRQDLYSGERARNALVFSMVVFALGAIANVLFLRVLSYTMQPWYFLVLLLICGLGIDLVIGALQLGNHARVVRAVVAALLMLAVIPNLWPLAHQRRTNVDLVAESISAKANAKDIVVVSPWVFGVSFQRYYHGSAQWLTLPPLSFTRFHRYDLLKEKMIEPEKALTPVLDKIQATLSAGHRLWFVGPLIPTTPGQKLPRLIPAPNGPSGWNEGYSALWNMHIHQYLAQHALRRETFVLQPPDPVSPYEMMPIILIEGWRP